MKYKICTYPECEHQGKPQPIENFYDSNRGKYGKDQYCKKCKIKYKNERKNLQRQLNTLKFEDIKQFTSTVACLYINRKDINQIITLCQITKDQLKKILIYEELFEYRICKKCFQLKHFDEYYRKPDKG